MKLDFSEQVKELIGKYEKEQIKFAKNKEILLKRIKASESEVKEEILGCENLEYTEKQKKDNEARYVLFFVYSKKRGRIYVLTFSGSELIIITTFPMGRKTLIRYRKKRFK